MQQQTMPDHPHPRSGVQAVMGALLAVVGMLATAHPGNPILRTLAEVAPRLAEAVPVLITSCGTLIAAFSTPPSLREQP